MCSVNHLCVVFEVCVWIIVWLEDPNMAHYKIPNRVSHLLIFICWYLIDSGGKHAICDRVQLLTLTKACNCFLMCTVLSLSLSLSKSITFSKEERGWKVGGTVTRLGGTARECPPPGAGAACLIVVSDNWICLFLGFEFFLKLSQTTWIVDSELGFC